jgi:hypothetical protein
MENFSLRDFPPECPLEKWDEPCDPECGAEKCGAEKCCGAKECCGLEAY